MLIVLYKLIRLKATECYGRHKRHYSLFSRSKFSWNSQTMAFGQIFLSTQRRIYKKRNSVHKFHVVMELSGNEINLKLNLN